MHSILANWNTLPPLTAEQEILPCCNSSAWSSRLTAARPYPDLQALLAASDLIWQALPEQDWLQAFESHPRLGQSHADASPKSLAWSEGEQANLAGQATQALSEANFLYESRFDRTFILCATGKSAEDILTTLHHRLANSPEQELLEAAEQQRQITNLRLQKWLEGR